MTELSLEKQLELQKIFGKEISEDTTPARIDNIYCVHIKVMDEDSDDCIFCPEDHYKPCERIQIPDEFMPLFPASKARNCKEHDMQSAMIVTQTQYDDYLEKRIQLQALMDEAEERKRNLANNSLPTPIPADESKSVTRNESNVASPTTKSRRHTR